MAFLRFTQTWNSIPDFRGCFNWCLGRHNSSPDEAKHVTEELDADSTSKRRHYSATENGSAYNYDDQETSSDSDDEVLRHYRQSMRKVPSKRSIHSTNSCGGSDGDGTQDQVARASLHDAERGHSSEVGAGAPLASSTPSSSSRSRGAGVGAEGAGGAAAARQSLISERGVDVRDPASPDEGLSNQAFQADSPDAPPSHASSSEPAMSGYGDSTSADQEEHLFDVSDLQSREDAGLISKCGTLDVTFNYEGHKERMTVTVHQAREIPTKERGGANNSQVRLLLLPTKKTRHKTKIKPGADPVFDETFVFKVPVAEVTNMGLRLRLYGCERMRRERMIGENVIGFANVNLDTPTTHALVLEPRSNLSRSGSTLQVPGVHGDSKFDVSSLSRSDSASSTQSMQHGGMPELLVGLSYNGTTGRLAVEAIKGSNFRNMAMNKPPDTYVKFTLMSPNGQEIARSKTSIRRGQPNPLYKETFMFQVALFQLPDVTLMVSVYNKRSMKRKEMVGWFSLGLNNSGEEELSHWTDMRQSKGEQVCRWHVLLES